MAQFFPGRTLCALCEQAIHSEPVAFPAFLPRGHSLWKYADACFRRECLDVWKHNATLSRLYREFRSIEESIPGDLKTLEEREEWFALHVRRFDDSVLREDRETEAS